MLSLNLLLLEFLGDTVKDLLLGLILPLKLLLLGGENLELLGQFLSVAGLLLKVLDLLEQFLLLLLLVGELNLKLTDLSDAILHIFAVEGQLFLQLLDVIFLLLDPEVGLGTESLLSLGESLIVLLALEVSLGLLILHDSLEVVNILLEGSLDGLVLLDGSLDLSFLLGESHLISVLESLLLSLELLKGGDLLSDGSTELLDVLLHVLAGLLPLGFVLASPVAVLGVLFDEVLLLVGEGMLEHGHLFAHLLDLGLLGGEVLSGLLEDLLVDSLKLKSGLVGGDGHVGSSLNDLPDNWLWLSSGLLSSALLCVWDLDDLWGTFGLLELLSDLEVRSSSSFLGSLGGLGGWLLRRIGLDKRLVSLEEASNDALGGFLLLQLWLGANSALAHGLSGVLRHLLLGLKEASAIDSLALKLLKSDDLALKLLVLLLKLNQLLLLLGVDG